MDSIAQTGSARNPARKWARVLSALVSGPRTSRQLELDPVFDHCAPTTIAALRGRGVEILAEIVEVRGFAGLPARVARYALTDAGRETARRLLADS